MSLVFASNTKNMNNEWGDKEAQKSARTLTTSLSLEDTCLRAASEFFGGHRDSEEVLGDIFTALRRQDPEQYDLAIKRAINHRCRDCDEPVRVRGYCRIHYQAHKRVGDL